MALPTYTMYKCQGLNGKWSGKIDAGYFRSNKLQHEGCPYSIPSYSENYSVRATSFISSTQRRHIVCR